MNEEHQVAVSLLRGIKPLHSMPNAALRLLELTRFDDYEMQAVARCVAQDPALAAKLLQLTNSAQFSLYRPVSSVQHAISLLGRRSLRLVALNFGLVGRLTEGLAKSFVEDFWTRAATMAVAARNIARLDDGVDPHEAYTAALLADLGLLAFAQAFGEEYVRLYRRQTHDDQLPGAERQRFGCGHPALGACLLADWNAPSELVDAIDRHHATSPAGNGLARAVRHANRLTEILLRPAPSDDVWADRRDLSDAFSLDRDGFIDLCRTIWSQLGSEWEVDCVAKPTCVDCGQLLTAAHE